MQMMATGFQDHGRIGQPGPPMGMPPNGVMGSSMMNMLGQGQFPKTGPIDTSLAGIPQEQMLAQGPAMLSQLNSAAELMAATGDFARAIGYYEKITTLDPDNGGCWTALGHCYLLTDELQKAFGAYQKALYSLPDVRDPQLWYGIGLLYDKVSSPFHALSLRRMSMRYRR